MLGVGLCTGTGAVDRMTDRHDWKHDLPATSLADGNNFIPASYRWLYAMRPSLSVQYIISLLPFTSTTSHLFGDLLWRRWMMSLTHHISVPRLLAPRIVYYPVLFTTMEMVMQVMAVFGSSSTKHRCPEWMHFYGTRMHSNRMRTVHCSSRLRGGGGYLRGVSAGGRVSVSGGGGVSARGWCLPHTPSPLWMEWLIDRCKNITLPQLHCGQ